MLTPEQIEALGEYATQITDPVVDFLIQDIAKRVSEAGQLTSTAAYQAWTAQWLGVSQKELKKKLQKLLNKSNSEIEALLTQSAEVGYQFDLDRFPTVDAIPFAENSALQNIVNSAIQMAGTELQNLTRTIGFVCPDGKARTLTTAYQNTCAFAFQKVVLGGQDFQSAVREATKSLAENGILQIDYKSGLYCTVEAATRRNVLGGMGLINEAINEYTYSGANCDGWEISAHAGSAPDHEPIQGNQFSDKEYTSLNNSLVRRIGTLNCGHSSFPIILGVNAPQYTSEELEQMRKDNETGVTYNGKHYTLYEASQRQRKLERTIRKQKRRILVDEATGDKELLQTHQIRLQVLKQEYARFSKKTGLPMQHARMETAGFTWKHGKAAETTANEYYKYWAKSIGADKSAKTLADYYEMKYNRPEEYKLLQQYAKDVKAGWISPLSGFENYKNLHSKIQTEIVGRTAANGTIITGQVPHFMQRVIGTMVDPEKSKSYFDAIRRSGVAVEDIKNAIFSPIKIGEIQTRKTGQRSVKLIGENCAVTINPDTGMLIQTNPL